MCVGVDTMWGGHDVVSVYGGYGFRYEVHEFIFAMDSETLDIVAAGTVEIYTGRKHFIYYLKDGSCATSWHFMFDETEFTKFNKLTIRSDTQTIYGLVSKSSTEIRMFKLALDEDLASLSMSFYTVG